LLKERLTRGEELAEIPGDLRALHARTLRSVKAEPDVVELTEDVSDSPLWNQELAPTPLARRDVVDLHIAAQATRQRGSATR
jgi:hypothetical protein